MYLVLYNAVCACGWAYVLFLAIGRLQTRELNSSTLLWTTIKEPLTWVQTAAVMEIVHSLIGLVPSPVMTVAMQVSSRLLLVWCYSRVYPQCQQSESLYLMVISWGLVEVPRYLFYVFAQFKSMETPYLLFWLRYSLFMVLYPTGISGELLQMWASLSDPTTTGIWIRTTYCIFAIYAGGSPYMISNMAGNRKSSFKKRALLESAAKNPPPPPSGLVWPVTNEKTKERGTTDTNKKIWSQAIGAVDAAAAAKIDNERNWRFGYAKHAEVNVKTSLSSPSNATKIAEAGLAAAHGVFQFVREGKIMTLAAAMKEYSGTFNTLEIKGKYKDGKTIPLEVPYGGKDATQPYFKFKGNKDVLTGDALVAQINRWEEWGTIEPSCANSLRNVAQDPKLMDLSDRYFVLLGATSAMGPLDLLLKYGANIIAGTFLFSPLTSLTLSFTIPHFLLVISIISQLALL